MVEAGVGKEKKSPFIHGAVTAWARCWQKVGHSCWVFFSGKAKLGCEWVEAGRELCVCVSAIPIPCSSCSAAVGLLQELHVQFKPRLAKVITRSGVIELSRD